MLRLLAARGHHLHLAVERDEGLGGLRLVEALAAEYPGITYGNVPGRADDEWTWIAGRLRLGLDYLRYQHPVFDRAYQLRSRARERTPGAFVALGRGVRSLQWARRQMMRLVRTLERAIPDDAGIVRYVQSRQPDVLLLTPLIDLGSSQIDYLRAARTLRIPAALCVWSWDHLSSKALIREQPDRVFVWNETQRQEAVELHGVDPGRIVATGAQCFDQWFDRQPSRDRELFCRTVGLDPSKPFVIYVCSALFAGSPEEAGFVVEWIRALRASSLPAVSGAQVLVRPHPSRTAEWDGVDVRGTGAVVWGSNPVDTQSKADYFDSLYHSAAVVGINTSAFVEAGIVGRPVFAIVVPEFAANQTGTVHFDYLTSVAGGLVTISRSLEEHSRQLDAALVAPPQTRKPFVEAFLRPRGIGIAATPVFADEVETLGGLTPDRSAEQPAAFWRWAVGQLARTRTSRRLEPLTLSWRELESAEHVRDEQQRKALRRAEERAASDPARLEALRARGAAFEQDRLKREAKRRRRRGGDRQSFTESEHLS